MKTFLFIYLIGSLLSLGIAGSLSTSKNADLKNSIKANNISQFRFYITIFLA